MRYRTILLIAILPAAWGQARHYRFNCAGSGAFPCQAEAVSLPATGSLTVNAVNGSVFVETWDAQEIFVRAEVRGSGANGMAGVQLVTSPGQVSVRAKASLFVDLIIELPSNTDLTISTVNGGSTLHGVTGNVIANAVNGGVFIVVGGEWAGQSLVVDTVNGDIAVAVPADCSARVTAAATGGTITADFPVETTAGTVRAVFDLGQPGSSTITLATVKGDIKLWSED